MNKDEIIEVLQNHASSEYKKNVVRMGIPETACIGVPVPVIKKLAKQLQKSNDLADELWDSRIHEARLLAVLLWNHKLLTFKELDKLMGEVISWDLSNYFCKHLIIKMDAYEQYIFEWITSSHPYKRRSAFVLWVRQ